MSPTSAGQPEDRTHHSDAPGESSGANRQDTEVLSGSRQVEPALDYEERGEVIGSQDSGTIFTSEGVAASDATVSTLVSCYDRARSNRSRFITLSQAATKSLTNFSCASALA